MNTEGLNINRFQKTPETVDKNEIVTKVFKEYHNELIRWCIKRLKKIKDSYVSNDLEGDAEEIVQNLYKKLLTTENPIDFKRKTSEIGSYLHTALNSTLDTFIAAKKAKKRVPENKLISIEETIGEDEEKNMPLKLREFFIEKNNEKDDDKLRIIESALSQLKEKYPRMAEIIRRRYELGETQEEIGKDYKITKTAIQHIEKEALGKIRKILKQKPLN